MKMEATGNAAATALVGTQKPAEAVRTSRLGLGGLLRTLLTPLASLHLTVALLVLSVFVTWVATLQQTRMDIWDVKRAHFPAILTPIDFEVFFPPAWFPGLNRPVDQAIDAPPAKPIPGRFYVPSGFLLIVAMLINLTAAHLLRMRIQASGKRLWGGIAVALVGAVATWVVIFAGQNPDGFQAHGDSSFYSGLWIGIQVLLVALAIALAIQAWRASHAQPTVRWASMVGAVAMLGSGVAVLWGGEAAFVGDSAMRILWQLIQGSVVAAISLVGCLLVFRRKGGVVLVHVGITMLLANEIWVTLTNVEQQMHLYEGQTSSQTVDNRSSEMFIADLRDPDRVVMMQIPGDRLARGQKIDDPALPFVVQALEWHANSDLEQLKGDQPRTVTEGFGRDYRILPRERVAGTSDTKERNWAAARIQLFDRKSGQPMGIWLVSELAQANDVRDRVTVDGVPWEIGLRWTHIHKPYSINLVDVSSRDYVGTKIPRTFESTILLSDPRQQIENARRNIWMNNPLRYGNETFYQSGYEKLPDGREYTVLQIVQNKGWMIPYVACMYVVIGLLSHFAGLLLRFLAPPVPASLAGGQLPPGSELSRAIEAVGKPGGKQKTTAVPPPAALPAPATSLLSRRHWAFWVPVSLACLFVIGELAKASRAPTLTLDGQQTSLDSFARIPLTIDGRIQPMESLARNTARVFGHRETVLNADGKTRVPALKWFADTIFGAPGYDRYLIFRIEDPGVLGELGLDQRRKGLRYSLQELENARPRLDKALADARKLPEDQWTNTQKRLLDVQSRLSRLYGLKSALGDPEQMNGDMLDQIAIAKDIVSAEGLPLLVPTRGPDGLWLGLYAAHWIEQIRQMASESGKQSIDEVADWIAEREVIGSMRQGMIRQLMIEAVLADPQVVELMRKTSGASDVAMLRREMEQSWDKFPPKVYEMLLPQVEPAVDAELQKRLPEIRRQIRELVRGVYGQADPVLDPAWRANYQHLLGLGKAWRERDGKSFEELASRHLAVVDPAVLGSGNHRGLATEVLLNRFSPFYVSTVLYLLAGVCCVLAWAGFRFPLQRAAAWIVWIGVAVHLAGLVMRVVITGRPPVTNLYSSFLFVSVGTVLLMQWVERFSREGILTLKGAIFGVVSLLWAYSSSVADGDTMIVLRAVLDTQFWLSTHVICISMGYAATAAAGLIGLAWILRSLVDGRMTAATSRNQIQLVYGVTAFALLLSFFGTVLGGLWGDDSWGRFWGWDPKENGALMIVLWNAVLLHARWAGIVRDRGIAALSIFGIVVTIWSWECVNQLGVGLHSYGVSASKLAVVLAAMGVLSAISLLGLLPRAWWRSPAVRGA